MGRLTMLQPRVVILGGRRPGKTTAWAHQGRESRQARGYGAEWERKRKRVLSRDAGLCQPCLELGATTTGNEVDHRIPKFEGGTDDESNLQTICPTCHQAKTAAESKRARGG